MFPQNITRAAAAGLLATVVALAGCGSNESPDGAAGGEAPTTQTEGHDHGHDHDHGQQDQKASLGDWEGTWLSLGAYAHHPELAEPMKQAAAEHGETVEDIKKEISEARDADFEGLVIDDDTITFVTKEADLDDPKEEGASYTFSESKDVNDGEHSYTWFIFEGDKDAPYKYVYLMPLHGEETLAHFHMRYGDDKDEILNHQPEGWFPTFVDPTETTTEQVAETLLHHDH